MSFMKWMCTLTLLSLLMTACGQKGDLYLPDTSSQDRSAQPGASRQAAPSGSR